MPISRIGGGYYQFGSKKIYAKIMNRKLVVRVGGGYMDMGDFIATYAESERLKLQHMDPKEVEALHSQNKDKRIIDTVPLSSQKQKSPTRVASSGRKSIVGK
jgi:hypothetical protein